MTATATVQTVPMTKAELAAVLVEVTPSTNPGKPALEDGTRVHIHYKSFGKPTAAAIVAAQRAEELGLPRDRYTGRVTRVWKSGSGDTLVTLFVELERDHAYRSLNLNKGEVFKFVVLGA